jgi:hypothetical protein
MQTIKTNLGNVPAWKVLATINEGSSTSELVELDWGSDQSKIDVLTGKKTALHFDNENPLTEDEARIAVNEYKEAMGITK